MQIQLATPTPETQAANPGPGQANPDQVNDFEHIFDTGPQGDLAIDPMDPANLDVALMNGIEKVNREHDAMVSSLEKAIDVATSKDSMSISSLLRVQVELANVSFHEQLTVKVADKSSEGIKTLFRNQ